MACVPLESQRPSFIARFASKIIGLFVSSSDVPEVGDRFVVHPTTGTLELSPAYRDKAAKALMREVRRMQFHLKLRSFGLYFRQFMLDLARMRLLAIANFIRNFNDLRFMVGHGHLPHDRHTTY
jgi:hypothetical protein